MPRAKTNPTPCAVDIDRQIAEQRRQRSLLRLADPQGGVVSSSQLTALGFSKDAILTRARRGYLIALHRGVYIVGRAAPTPRGHHHAALLAIGPGAFLSHRSAAAAYGFRAINRFEIHVTVTGSAHRSRENLVVHRTTALHPHDVRTRDGLRVSSIPRMLVDLAAAGEAPGELHRLITEADRRDLLHLDRLRATLARHHGRPGIPTLTRVLGDYVWKPRPKSEFERDFAAFLATDPRIPPPITNVTLERRYEIDVLWPQQRLAVELDGRLYHQAVKDRERDNAKDIWLQHRGIRVMRIRDFRFEHDKPGVRRDLHAFLAHDRAAAA